MAIHASGSVQHPESGLSSPSFSPMNDKVNDTAQPLGRSSAARGGEIFRSDFASDIAQALQSNVRNSRLIEALYDSLRQAEEKIRQLEHSNGLVEEKYIKLEDVHRRTEVELQREKTSNQIYLDNSYMVTKERDELRAKIGQGGFALVLIDGDGVIFNNELLAAGAEGGARAASDLQSEVKRHVKDKHPDSGNWRILVLICVNFAGLSDALVKNRIIPNDATLGAFTKAFTQNQPMFLVNDVGSGKERADYKIQEFFRWGVEEPHCQHIIFGGAHDRGYLNLLDRYKNDKDVGPRLSLLESTPAEIGYRALNFPIVNFPDIFRTTKVPTVNTTRTPIDNQTFTYNYRLTGDHPSTLENGKVAKQATTAIKDRISGDSSQSSSPSVQNIGLDRRAGSPVGSSTAPSFTLKPPGSVGYAERAARDTQSATTVSETPTYTTMGSSRNISIAPAKTNTPSRKHSYYNKRNERIDGPLPRPEANAMQRLNLRVEKEGKVCNNYHLNGHCNDRDWCNFVHAPRLSASEQLALRNKVRERPCSSLRQDYVCTNPDCWFGHQCSRAFCKSEKCPYYKIDPDWHSIADKKPAYILFEDGTRKDIVD